MQALREAAKNTSFTSIYEPSLYFETVCVVFSYSWVLPYAHLPSLIRSQIYEYLITVTRRFSGDALSKKMKTTTKKMENGKATTTQTHRHAYG